MVHCNENGSRRGAESDVYNNVDESNINLNNDEFNQ